MAIKDFEKYFSDIKNQYFEMKENLAEFEQRFKDGHITEDRLQTVKENIEVVEDNYQKLLYVELLLKKRKRQSKKQQKTDEALLNGLSVAGADGTAVKSENKSAIEKIRTNLEYLKERP